MNVTCFYNISFNFNLTTNHTLTSVIFHLAKTYSDVTIVQVYLHWTDTSGGCLIRKWYIMHT